ncbi:MAG TPA: diphthamide biosynthesis enzyme Dph2 [Nitrososphaeraceae archaeon]|nr:diphthamide biosynthesis enzyme Dph2 [Nitrososphaeraceae archaeon]
MIQIDEVKIHSIINEKKPHSVALDGPDGLLKKIQSCAHNLSEKYKIPVYVIGDTSWGSCDLNLHAVETLGVDILFNIGHTIAMEKFGDKVVMIDAFDDVDFSKIATRCAIELMKNFKKISLVTNSQYLPSVQKVKKIFESHGYEVIIGRGKGHLNDAQVFGCEFYPAYDSKNDVDAYIFLGQSMFHSASIAIVTQKPTFMMDPYFNEYSQINDFAQKLEKKAILSVLKAQDAKTIGIIIGLKEGQFAKIKALEIKNMLENQGKRILLIAMTEITDERLLSYQDVDAFVQVACPRIGTDNHFHKPVLSAPQAMSLIKILKGEPQNGFLQIKHWL